MIIDLLPSSVDSFALKFRLRDWQKAIVADIFESRNRYLGQTKIINLGHSAGHTYLSKALSQIEFGLNTKIYASDKQNYGEYGSFVLRPMLCHNSIDILDPEEFESCGLSFVDLVIVDMNNHSMRTYRRAIDRLRTSMPDDSMLLLLDADFL